MTQMIQAGTILIGNQPLMTHALGMESEIYLENWRVLKALDALNLDRKIHAAGWNFFFMAAEVKAIFLGAYGAQKVQRALQRIFAKVRRQNYNGLEVTGVVARRFLGVPYTVVSAHSRHLQQSCYLDSAEERRVIQHDSERASG
jgi:hypothetical protein